MTTLDTSYLRRAFTDKNKHTFYEFYKAPCFVCGKTGNCMVKDDGTTVICTRMESPIKFSDKNVSYVHHLENGVKVTGVKANTNKNRKKAPINLLDSRYRAFLSTLKVNQTHCDHLFKGRGLSQETVLLRKYRSYPDSIEGAKALLGTELYNHSDFKSEKVAIGFPGLYLNKENQWDLVKHDGILIPYRNEHMEITGFQIRTTEVKSKVSADPTNFKGLHVRIKEQPNLIQVLDYGEIIKEFRLEVGQSATVTKREKHTSIKLEKSQRYIWLSSANYNYGTPAATEDSPLPVHVAVPTYKLKEYEKLAEAQMNAEEYLVNIKSDAVWVTEGALKADIAVDLISEAFADEIETVGDVVLAVPGVNTWKTLLPTLKAVEAKRVNIAFDMDAITNDKVAAQYKAMLHHLVEEGYEVYAALWPNTESTKGLDDALHQKIRPQFQCFQ
ncbi:DUF3854 domain-containing protein [Solibacillus sp. NPDC093137]|uniref:DUF3854 domain-containing protein n=1 Tax=Solibacillus sp. NPDC093137 TaxID=3390678 RepID=UPI003CFC6162